MPFWKRNLARLFFLPVALWLRINKSIRNRMEIPNVEMFIMNPCNPQCIDCKDLNSLYPNNVDLDAERLIRDADDFLGNVNRVHRFIITGGETLLYRELHKLLSYLIRQEKIDLINILTTGAIIPESDILELLKHRKVLVTISSFPEKASPNKPHFIAILEDNHINYIVKDTWRDLGSFNPVANSSAEDLKNRFAQCIYKNHHNLNNGEYHLCPRSVHGKQLGQFSPDDSDSVTFRDRKDSRLFKKELRNLLRKEYLTACSKCRGSHRETILDDLLNKLLGSWYSENIYFKYRIHNMSSRKRDLARLFFLPIALWIKLINSIQHRLELPHVEMPITTRCNLHCRDCGNLIPFYKHPVDFDVEQLIQDIDDFLYNVDRVHRFFIMGGETFLYRELHKLVSYLIRQDKIDLINLFTNGSIIPESDIMQLLKHRKILVSISSFPEEVSPNKPCFIATMEANHINYRVEDNLWLDLGGFNPAVDSSAEAVKQRYTNCCIKSSHNISNGEYHLCPRSVHGEQLGQFSPDDSDRVIFRGRKNPQAFRKELRTLFHKEYITACSKCTGTTEANVIPGIQPDRGNL
ncbi:MAG: radical SAM protein [Deltaproteobacteria bacterium]|nr:radical SAM protein [Deltaproteobacteria bacterium]